MTEVQIVLQNSFTRDSLFAHFDSRNLWTHRAGLRFNILIEFFRPFCIMQYALPDVNSMNCNASEDSLGYPLASETFVNKNRYSLYFNYFNYLFFFFNFPSMSSEISKRGHLTSHIQQMHLVLEIWCKPDIRFRKLIAFFFFYLGNTKIIYLHICLHILIIWKRKKINKRIQRAETFFNKY